MEACRVTVTPLMMSPCWRRAEEFPAPRPALKLLALIVLLYRSRMIHIARGHGAGAVPPESAYCCFALKTAVVFFFGVA
jgi:hypothetical protein